MSARFADERRLRLGLFLGTAAIACGSSSVSSVVAGTVIVRSDGARTPLLGLNNVFVETHAEDLRELFVLLLPALILIWTCTVWLLQSLQEALGAMR